MTCTNLGAATIVTLKEHLSGDTWKGLSVRIQRNGAAADLTGCQVDMHMRKTPTSAVVIQAWSTAIQPPHTAPTIEIASPTEGLISVLKRNISATHDLVFDIQVTFPNGDVKTCVRGVLPISTDITRSA